MTYTEIKFRKCSTAEGDSFVKRITRMASKTICTICATSRSKNEAPNEATAEKLVRYKVWD